eukprot:TRINITY_DN35917_c0_g1_i1.p1 TRINITY_DN35917_c0_g1~~TRINITY_DN35917_c0_g1_i1.p1  ORF type:complete len:120 (-),score=16.76 TRINITY_DN35917_c0_g1_i1:88-447(-)
MNMALNFIPFRTEVTPICSVRSSPLSTVEWYKDGKKLQKKGVVVESTVGDTWVEYELPLEEMGSTGYPADSTWVIDEDRLGVYECRAKNYLGEASAQVDIFRSCHEQMSGKRCWKMLKN